LLPGGHASDLDVLVFVCHIFNKNS
jgi:hypothetical protein